MNVVQEIKRINAKELESGSSASWHDQYKNSAYIYVGGLPHQLTEGDVITIFSQYGEVVDISLPRDAATQKPKGFAFLMYADQRSTILAVDNLGGSKVLERTLRVDHVLNYKQLERDKETGKMVERDAQSLAAHPDKFKSSQPNVPGSPTYSSSSHDSIDPEDPMRDFLIQERKAAKLLGGGKSKGGDKKRSREGESKEERKLRRDKKKRALELKEESKKGKEKERTNHSGSSSRRDDKGNDERRRDDRSDRKDYRDDRRDVSVRRHYDDERRGTDSRRNDDRDDSRRSGGGREDIYNTSRSRDRDDDRGDRRERDSGNGDDREKDRGTSKNSFADLERYARG